MTVELVGSLTAGALNPATLAAILPCEAKLSADVSAALALQAQAEIGAPSLSVQYAAVVEAEAALNLGISLGLPGVCFSVSAAAALVASARLALGNLSILVSLLSAPSGGMFVYSFAGGAARSWGSALVAGRANQPPPGVLPPDEVSGLLIGAGTSGWATVAPYFGGV